jgi:nitronate monooxygenase
VGTKQTWLESTLNKNKTLKKWVKMIRYMMGSNAVTKAAKVTYKTVWVAGPTIETTAIRPVTAIVDVLTA